MIRAAASLTGLTIVLGLVLYLTLGDGDSSPSTTASPSPVVQQPTATAAPRPTPDTTPMPAPTPLPDEQLPDILRGHDVLPLLVDDPIALPDDLALIVSTGCVACDGPATGLQRIYRDHSGDLQFDPLLSMDRLNLPEISAHAAGGFAPQFGSCVFAPDGSEIFASICLVAWCGGEGLNAWSPDARTAILQSGDGGVTWQLTGIYDRSMWIEAYVDSGQLLLAVYPSAAIVEYETFPSFVPITPPMSGYVPSTVLAGVVFWQPGAGKAGPLLRGDGATFLDLGHDASLGDPVLRDTEEPMVLLPWFSKMLGARDSEVHANTFISTVTSSGEIVDTFLIPAGLWNFVSAPDGTFIANMSGPWWDVGVGFTDNAPASLFVHIDPGTGRLAAIRSDGIYLQDLESRNTLFAVQTGPFARIDGTGSCLNLRSSPGLDAAKVACLADGVLLRHDSVAVTNQDVEWLQVTAPDGTEGWAATEFLEW